MNLNNIVKKNKRALFDSCSEIYIYTRCVLSDVLTRANGDQSTQIQFMLNVCDVVIQYKKNIPYRSFMQIVHTIDKAEADPDSFVKLYTCFVLIMYDHYLHTGELDHAKAIREQLTQCSAWEDNKELIYI